MRGVWVKQPQLSLDCKIITSILSQAHPWTTAPKGSSTSSEPAISTIGLLFFLVFCFFLDDTTTFRSQQRPGPIVWGTVSISSCWWRSFHSHQRRWTLGLCSSGYTDKELRKSEAKVWIHESFWGSSSSAHLNSNHKGIRVKTDDLPKLSGRQGIESKG